MADQFGNPSLSEAISNFAQGSQQLALTRSLSQASDAVDHIRNNFKEGLDQRREMTNVAQKLAMDMMSKGASASAVEQAYNTIKPKNLASSDQAILEGNVTGDQSLINAGIKSDQQAKSGELLRDQQRFAFQDKVLAQRAAKDAAGKPLSPIEVKDITALEVADDGFANMLKMVKDDKSLVGIGSNVPLRTALGPKYAAFDIQRGRLIDAYRVAVTGAGASDAERASLESRLPNGSETLPVFLSKLNEARKIGQAIKKRHIENLGKAGRNVDKFNIPNAAAPSQSINEDWKAFTN